MNSDSVQNFDHGKYVGCISHHPDGYQFLYSKHSQFFGISRTHVTKEAQNKARMDSYAKAIIYQKQYSDSHGLTRNQWRRVGDVIEVQLQKGLIMTCDPDMLKHVEARVWTARKGTGKKTYYASCRKSKKKNYEACQFHNLVCPEFKQVDHIDRNGLNNCRSNLREGSGRINNQNKNKPKNNTSGHTGVKWHEPSGSQKGRWNGWRRVGDVIEVKLQHGLIMTCDPDMLKHVQARVWTARKGQGKKTYYASCRKSKRKNYEACQFHNLVCPEFKQVDHIDRNGLNNCRSNLREGSGRINAQNKGIQKNNTSGHTGVEWHKPSGSRKGRWKAVWKDEEGKRRSKSFTVVNEEDKERVKALAIAHREAMAKKTREFLGMM